MRYLLVGKVEMLPGCAELAVQRGMNRPELKLLTRCSCLDVLLRVLIEVVGHRWKPEPAFEGAQSQRMQIEFVDTELAVQGQEQVKLKFGGTRWLASLKR